MTFKRRRAARWHGGRRLFPVGMPGALALLCMWCMMVVGCRDDAQVTDAGRGSRIVLNLSTGDVFVYERWGLDEYGYHTGDPTVERWRVIGTGIDTQGVSGVAVVVDSVSAMASDTVLLRSSADGEIYQFGFLARLAVQAGVHAGAPRWDLLLRSGPAIAAPWVVGVADSAASDTVRGRTIGAPDYFSVQVNGKPNVFSAYRVELYGSWLQFTFWVTDAPPCFPGFREESATTVNGFEAFLTSVRVAHG